ncbi:hypothetical protein [Burkholderia paludis]|uniref:hypothetical protein n=1 Tax=Burkholderia paludis TaxID=1506587 RepID=UPI00126A777F|nr:hypothetical protein [Burkholderia paludis]
MTARMLRPEAPVATVARRRGRHVDACAAAYAAVLPRVISIREFVRFLPAAPIVSLKDLPAASAGVRLAVVPKAERNVQPSRGLRRMSMRCIASPSSSSLRARIRSCTMPGAR